MQSPPIESPIRRWREEAGLTQAQLATATGISSTTVIWNELLLYPEPSSRIISVFQYGSRVKPYSPPVGPLGNYQNYVDEYNAAQRTHRRLSEWENDYNFLGNLKNREWFRALSKQEAVSERLRGRTINIQTDPRISEVGSGGVSRQAQGIKTESRQGQNEASQNTPLDGNSSSDNIRGIVPLHPFEEWRIFLGYTERVAFCRSACVSPPQVLNYERARQRSMPKTVRLALSQVLETNFLDRLEYYGALYYRYRNLGTELA